MKVGNFIRKNHSPLGINHFITGVAFIFLLLSIALVSGCEERTDESLQEAEVPITLKHPINEQYISIAQYELFYRNERMESKEAVTLHALRDAIDVYALLEYLEAKDIRIDEETVELQRKLLNEQLAQDLQNPDFQHYFNELKDALQIDEQDYIEHYLLVNKTHDILANDMFSNGVGLEIAEDGVASYPTSESELEYREQMGISFDYVEYLAESIPQYLPEPTTAPSVAFDNEYLKLTTNRDGAVILRSKEFSMSDLNYDQYNFLHKLEAEHQLQKLARYNFSSYQELLETIVLNDAERRDMAEQLLAIFDIVETTLDWEFGELIDYRDDTLPTFEQNELRQHTDITQQLIEHHMYYQSDNTPERFYAYRVATENIVEMYGLFNYLQQDYGVALDAQAIETIRTEQEQHLQQQLENPYFKRFIDDVLETFHIPLSTYIDEYLVVLAEYEQLVELMQEQQIGLDPDGRYNKGEVSARYRSAANMSWEQQFANMEELQETTIIEPLDPQPDFAIKLIPEGLELGLNDKDEYVFTDITYLPMWFTDTQSAAFNQLVSDHKLPPLSRYAVTQYIDHLEQIPHKTDSQNELLQLITIYQHSVTP